MDSILTDKYEWEYPGIYRSHSELTLPVPSIVIPHAKYRMYKAFIIYGIERVDPISRAHRNESLPVQNFPQVKICPRV